MRKVYILPNLITAFGLACGLFVIFKMTMVPVGSGYFDVIKKAVLILMVAAVADLIDGAVARAFKAESEFGVVFDSLADSISFGVAPSVLLLKALSLQPKTFFSFILGASALVFSICGILRLVRYTVNSKKEKDIISMTSINKNFTGLPIPAAAAAAISINLFFLSEYGQALNFSDGFKVIFLSFLMIFLGYLMVSRLKFPSLKSLNFRVRSFQLAFFAVLFASFVLFGFLHYFSIVFLLISWGYVFIAIIFTIIRKIAGKRSKTLEDFEPEQEDLE